VVPEAVPLEAVEADDPLIGEQVVGRGLTDSAAAVGVALAHGAGSGLVGGLLLAVALNAGRRGFRVGWFGGHAVVPFVGCRAGCWLPIHWQSVHVPYMTSNVPAATTPGRIMSAPVDAQR
jgi:hypothetical protein